MEKKNILKKHNEAKRNRRNEIGKLGSGYTHTN